MDTSFPFDVALQPSLRRPRARWLRAYADTANGLTNCGEAVPQQIAALGGGAGSYVLDNTPHVLSIGHRCQALGYSFYWPAYSDKPTITTLDGKTVALVTENVCPHFPPAAQAAGCPGVMRYSASSP